MEINLEALKQALRVSEGPLKDVQDVVIPEPLPVFTSDADKQVGGKRGLKSYDEWLTEIRKVWGNLHDEEKLAKSWLASLPAVQNLAASQYGGRTTGQGLALQDMLKKALAEVQRYDMENETREILKSFPDKKMKDIASRLGLYPSHVSRDYTRKAVSLLTKAFQRVVDRAT